MLAHYKRSLRPFDYFKKEAVSWLALAMADHDIAGRSISVADNQGGRAGAFGERRPGDDCHSEETAGKQAIDAPRWYCVS